MGAIRVLARSLGGGVVPFSSDAFEIWDFRENEIITDGSNKYFKGQNGHNLLITGYDFDAGFQRGFLYKTAATVSAPVGDAAFIAADVNNFFYTAGVPNQIPVISFTQTDIDFEHKLWCRQVSQVIDSDGIETKEAYVSQVVLYNTAKAGSDLVKCQSYFGLTTEELAYNWVSKTGLDSAGRGSKALPWLTTQYAENNAAVSANIYVKTGDYAEYDTFQYVMYNKKVNFHAIGRVNLSNSHPSYLGYLLRVFTQGDTSVKRYIIDEQTKIYTGAVLSLEGTNESLEHCFVRGRASGNILSTAVGVFDIKNSKFIALQGNALFYAYQNSTVNFENNLAIITSTANGINTATGAVIFNLKNNKFLGVWPTALFKLNSPGDKNIIGNTILQNSASNGYILIVENDLAQNLLFKGNNIKIKAVPVQVNQITTDKLLTSVNISKNTITIDNITKATLDLIKIRNNACIISTNKIDSDLNGTCHAIWIGSTGTNIDNAEVKNNVSVIRRTDSGYHIIVGDDASTTGDNHCNNVVIKENALYGQNYFNSSPASLGTHGILYGYSKGLITKNHINKTGIGCIAKWDNLNGADITYNVVIDTIWSLYSKGSNGSKFYNNFVRNSYLSQFYGIYIIGNNSPGGSDVAPSNIVIKNNVIINDIDSANNWLLNLRHESVSALICDYNVYYTERVDQKIVSLSNGNTYTFTEWQALGFDQNSVLLTKSQLNTQFPSGQFYPSSPIVGENLGTTYEDGLDILTNWGSISQVPNVVTKKQPTVGTWQVGAYIL